VSLSNISAVLFIVPIHSTRAARPTFSHKAHSFQLQVGWPDKLDAFCSRRPKSPSTVVVFLSFQRPWVVTLQTFPNAQELMS
jgi:hypothetical protein